MSKPRVCQPMLQPPVAGQQDKTFAVAIEAAYRVHIRNRHVITKGRTLTAELTDDIVRLVQQDVPVFHGNANA